MGEEWPPRRLPLLLLLLLPLLRVLLLLLLLLPLLNMTMVTELPAGLNGVLKAKGLRNLL